MKFELEPLLLARAGSWRYGYVEEDSDRDFMVLTSAEDRYEADLETGSDYFFVSLEGLRARWGHPLFLGNITGAFSGDGRLCAFLEGNRYSITYSAPGRTALSGLEYIAQGEEAGYNSTVKAGLRTAMILAHMAERLEDPFLFSEAEKAILIRARTGGVPQRERVEIYRHTICPLRRMPENTTVKTELFALLEEICKEKSHD